MAAEKRQKTAAPPAVPEATRKGFAKWWSANSTRAAGIPRYQRVPLLKAIETATAQVYESEHLNQVGDESLQVMMRRVVLESNMAGIEEFGELWFECIRAKMVRMVRRRG
jgi:hypothetical protein